jgi:glutaminyl-tRNA synthetase
MEFDAGTSAPSAPLDFVREIVAEDQRSGRHGGRVHTRFPPEPNGYLHIGPRQSHLSRFRVAQEFAGLCNLRFDDTNPRKRTSSTSTRFRKTSAGSVSTGRHCSTRPTISSCCIRYAEQLIRDGRAYVDSLSADEIREYRGT